MKKLLLLLYAFLLSSVLYGYTDSDLDGVDDAHDKCPNTPISDLVDVNGCTKKSLLSPHHFDIVLGASYYDSDARTLNTTDTYAESIQFDYYYKNFSLQASTSYFSTNGSGFSDSGLYDTFLGGAYKWWIGSDLMVRFGVGTLLPTYSSDLNNNKTDYTASLNLSYNVGMFNLFGGYGYTLVGDDDVDITASDGSVTAVRYQNTNALSAGVGVYMTQKLYGSVSYNQSDSIYKDVEDIKTASIYGYYSISKSWFTSLSYAYGISDSASKNYVSLRVGYYY